MDLERKGIYTELHAPVRKNFLHRRYDIRGLNETWQSDLIDMQDHSWVNKGHKYILVIIDNFSKYAYVEPLKSKTGLEVTHAFERVLKRAPAPVNLHVDSGKEYWNVNFKQLMAKYRINMYSTHSGLKASISERFNRTFKGMLYKNFSMKGKYEWLTDLQRLVNIYNNTKHSTIKMKPRDVNAKNEAIIRDTIYPYSLYITKNKFKVGDKVRITKYKRIFDKSYKENWTYEIFTVCKVLNTSPTTYKLKDWRNEILEGVFYQEEMQATKYPDVFLIEKVIRRKGNKKYVKWLGYDNTFNSWI